MLRPSRGGAACFPQHPGTDLVYELQVLGNRNKDQRRNEFSVLRRQTYQRLVANETAFRHFEERLIVQFETIVQHRVANRRLELESRLQIRVHLGHEEPETIA